MTLDLRIKAISKKKKNIETTQHKRDIKITKAIEEEEPGLLHLISSGKKDKGIIDDKAKDTDEQLEKQKIALEKYETKISEANETWKKLSEEAQLLEIDISGIEGNTKKSSGEDKKYLDLETKKKSIESSLNLLKSRYTVTLGEYSQKKVHLQTEVEKMGESMKKKNEYVPYILF